MNATAAALTAVITYTDTELAALKAKKNAKSDHLRSLSSFAFPFYYPSIDKLNDLTRSSKRDAKADYIWLEHWGHAFIDANDFIHQYHAFFAPEGIIISTLLI